MGRLPEVGGLFVGAGFNSQGIIYAPGAGTGPRGLGHRRLSQLRFRIGRRRPLRDSTGKPALSARTHPREPRPVVRHALAGDAANDGPRPSPRAAYRCAAAGGQLGETSWERPLWFTPSGQDVGEPYSYRRPSWHEAVGVEHRAARETVAFFDLSAFATFEVSGPNAVDVLQGVCTADVDTAVGRVTYTLALNERGGIELDGTVIRRSEQSFMAIFPPVSQRAAGWRLRRVVAGRACTVVDTTTALAVLHIAGPLSRALLTRLTPDDVTGAALRRFTASSMEVGSAQALVARVSFTGNLGYEIYVDADVAAALYGEIRRAGADLGLPLAGLHALNTLRSEVGFRHLGHDIGSGHTPTSAGLDRFVATNKTFRWFGCARGPANWPAPGLPQARRSGAHALA